MTVPSADPTQTADAPPDAPPPPADEVTSRAATRAPQRIRRVVRRVSDPRLVAGSGLFAAGWYLERYPDVAAAGIPPLRHFVTHGDRELRDPGPSFHAAAYSAHYPDVATSGMGPLVHYLRHGRAEGRVVTPVPGARGSAVAVSSARPADRGPVRLREPEVAWKDGALQLRCALGGSVALEVTG